MKINVRKKTVDGEWQEMRKFIQSIPKVTKYLFLLKYSLFLQNKGRMRARFLYSNYCIILDIGALAQFHKSRGFIMECHCALVPPCRIKNQLDCLTRH